MKRKTTLLIFAVIYLAAMALGFGFAGFQQLWKNTPTPPGPKQSNWVVVRVDDMSLEHPRLVSVWATFVTFTPGPQIFFKPIYTADKANLSANKLASLFAVNPDRTIAPEFMQEVDRLNIERSGLIIMDDTGFLDFTSWFKLPPGAQKASAVIPATGRTPAVKVPAEVQAYTQVCDFLKDANSPRSQALAWQSLVPNHILPHPNLELLSDLWDKILFSAGQTHCEVIAN